MLVWIVAFVAYQQLQDRVIQPLLYGRAVKVNPLIAILVLFAGAQIAGILGALIAIPVAASIGVIFKVLIRVRPPRHATRRRPGRLSRTSPRRVSPPDPRLE